MRFSELDWRRTPLGDLVLRRRWDPTVERDVHEIKLGDEFLMSSLFTVSETELGRRGVAELSGRAEFSGSAGVSGRAELDVAVGGLGLGYTALAVLDEPAVRSLVVIDALAEVIEWHERGLIPAGTRLSADPRCRLVHGDFFELVRTGAPFDPDPPGHPPDTDAPERRSGAEGPGRRFDAVLIDIDHSPRHLLDPGHADFYSDEGLRALGTRLRPEGVFALWSNDPPDDEFTALLTRRFARARAEVVRFANPFQDREATSTLYIAGSPVAT
ncbi:spermidine synthase family protein [Saccharomonospora saliphila]|uniref:hypothetical protein n=1 Tax=Saccharomonospora saliphila TaxID=369829 RepID=UPI00036C9BDF|nr:hypothetical protein [Saccharomonospora saliphila]